VSLPEIEDPYRFQRLLRECLARLDAAKAAPREGSTVAEVGALVDAAGCAISHGGDCAVAVRRAVAT
jgi:hypothetical protein